MRKGRRRLINWTLANRARNSKETWNRCTMNLSRSRAEQCLSVTVITVLTHIRRTAHTSVLAIYRLTFIIRKTRDSLLSKKQRKVNEKALRETQTLRAGCSRWSQKISPRRRPLPGAQQDHQNLISWRWSLPAPTDPVWWKSMHAISSYRGNNPALYRQDRLQYTVNIASTEVMTRSTRNARKHVRVTWWFAILDNTIMSCHSDRPINRKWVIWVYRPHRHIL